MNNKPSHNFPTPGLNTHLYLYNIRKQFLYFFKLHFLFNGKIWISDHTHKQNVLTIFYWIPISVLWHNLTKPDMEFVEVHMDEWTSRWQCSAATENWEPSLKMFSCFSPVLQRNHRLSQWQEKKLIQNNPSTILIE